MSQKGHTFDSHPVTYFFSRAKHHVRSKQNPTLIFTIEKHINTKACNHYSVQDTYTSSCQFDIWIYILSCQFGT